MNLPDKEKVAEDSWRDCINMVCADCTQRSERCKSVKLLGAYESAIKPQIEALESERDQLKAENERLREALRPFAESWTV